MNKNITVFKNIESLTSHFISRLHTCYVEAINQHGSFHISLSGGSTPKHLYEALANNSNARLFNWDLCHFYFGDERCVSPDHDDSNYHMASSALLSHIQIPDKNIHRIEAEIGNHNDAAGRYENILNSCLPKEHHKPQFDVVLLGMGPDGHIASLFPDTDALMITDQLTAAVYIKKLASWRITITYPIINTAKHIFMVVPGQAKADILHSLFNTPVSQRQPYPVDVIKNLPQVEWLLDTASAEKLNTDV